MDMNDTILNSKDVHDFLKMIKVERVDNTLDFLNAIILGVYKHIPFQNLTLLNSESRPDTNDIIKDMLLGIGGLCNTRNGFMYLLIKTLGFQVDFLSASMLQENCHVIVLVYIDEKKYLIDTGNGFPYLNAISLDNTLIFSHEYVSYRVIQIDNIFYMQHAQDKELNKWKNAYSFTVETVLFSSFNEMLDKQYSEIGWGPFADSIRLNKWVQDGGVIIRDKLFLKIERNKDREKYSFKNINDFKSYTQQYYGKYFTNLVNIEIAWTKYMELDRNKKGVLTT